jgi:hypothetical protein
MLRNNIAYFVIEACTADCTGTYEEAGFYPAASFGEAMTYIEEFYGDELVLVKHLELLDTSMVYMEPQVAAEIVANIFS